jgi:hypothetical protein
MIVSKKSRAVQPPTAPPIIPPTIEPNKPIIIKVYYKINEITNLN